LLALLSRHGIGAGGEAVVVWLARFELGIGEVDRGGKFEGAAVCFDARHAHARVRPRGEGEVRVSRGSNGGDVVAVYAPVNAQCVERGAWGANVPSQKARVEQLGQRQARDVIVRYVALTWAAAAASAPAAAALCLVVPPVAESFHSSLKNAGYIG
jgi:hypothetical protein